MPFTSPVAASILLTSSGRADVSDDGFEDLFTGILELAFATGIVDEGRLTG